MVLVIAVFGRIAHEYGDRGTDHGHANVHWLLGVASNTARQLVLPGFSPDHKHIAGLFG